MASLEGVRSLLAEFGDAYGISGLSLDEHGDVSLSIDGIDVFLHFEEADGHLIIETPFSELPDDDSAPDVLERLARGNFLGYETIGGTLALGPDNEIILMRCLRHHEIDQDILGLAMQAHVQGVRNWIAEVDLGSDDTEPSDEETRSVEPPAGMINPAQLA